MREIESIAGLRVLTIEEAANLGVVSQVVVDLSQGQMLGILLNGAAGEQAVAAADIQTIGADVVMVSSRQVAKSRAELPELEKFRRPANAAPLQVFTTSGRRLGAVSAVYVDPLEKTVTRYEVSGGPLKDMTEGILILPVIIGSVHGQDAVIIPDEMVAQEGRETGGLLAKLSTIGQKVKGQYQQTAERVEQAVDKGAETLKKEVVVAKERASDLSEKAKEQYQQTAEKVEGVVDKSAEALKREAAEVKERAEDLSDKAREQAHKAAGTIRKEAEELGDKAKDAVAEVRKGAGTEPTPSEPAAEDQPAACEAPAEAAATEAKPDSPAPARKRTRKEGPEA